MALIKCNKCGREVSDKASVCPKCSNPISLSTQENSAKHSSTVLLENIAFGVLAPIISFALIFIELMCFISILRIHEGFVVLLSYLFFGTIFALLNWFYTCWVCKKKFKSFEAQHRILRFYKFILIGIAVIGFLIGLVLTCTEDPSKKYKHKYELGIENCKEDEYADAAQWYMEEAKNGDAVAQYNLGICYHNGYGVSVDDVEAAKWWRKAAEQGNANAQYNLGVSYEKGIGVPQDYSEAARLYRMAAEQGKASAQNNLGGCYDKGNGVIQSYSEAAKWYRKAAEQGDADAQFNLGLYYYNGEGVAQDYSEAAKLWYKAAEQGHADAQYNLAMCYGLGYGVSRNPEEGEKWLRKAAEQGHEIAIQALKMLENEY